MINVLGVEELGGTDFLVTASSLTCLSEETSIVLVDSNTSTIRHVQVYIC